MIKIRDILWTREEILWLIRAGETEIENSKLLYWNHKKYIYVTYYSDATLAFDTTNVLIAENFKIGENVEETLLAFWYTKISIEIEKILNY